MTATKRKKLFARRAPNVPRSRRTARQRAPMTGRTLDGIPIYNGRTMFPYDPKLLEAVSRPPSSIAEVMATMQAIDAVCADGDGLKWFKWLYLQETSAGEQRGGQGGPTICRGWRNWTCSSLGCTSGRWDRIWR